MNRNLRLWVGFIDSAHSFSASWVSNGVDSWVFIYLFILNSKYFNEQELRLWVGFVGSEHSFCAWCWLGKVQKIAQNIEIKVNDLTIYFTGKEPEFLSKFAIFLIEEFVKQSFNGGYTSFVFHYIPLLQ